MFKNFFRLFRQALRDEPYDYTSGSIPKAVFLLAVPMMLEMSLESVFAVVDIFFVNRLGSDAVSIVGLTEAVITIIYSLAIGLSVAATAVVSRRVGEKNPEGASGAATQALLLGFIMTVLVSIPAWFYAEDILRIMGAEEQAIQNGIGYARWMFGGAGVVIFIFLINGIFRGAGNATLAMRSLWIGNGTNILLCPVFIFGIGPFPEMGVAGAGLATVIGRGTGVAYQLYKLFFSPPEGLSAKFPYKPDFRIIKSLVAIASPATVQFIIQSASWIFLTALVAKNGSEASAGYQTAIRLVVFFILPAWGISNAAATLVGQNLGAGHPERAEKSVNKVVYYNTAFMIFVMVFFLTCSDFLIGIFIQDKNGEPFRIAVNALQIIGTGYLFYGAGMVLMQAFNGAGDTRTPTMISFIGFWLIQIPLAWWWSRIEGWETSGIFWAVPVAETMVAGMYWYFYRKGKWKANKV